MLEAIEGLGFCPPGEGGKFVLDGAIRAPYGRLPVNTDGGGLGNYHPGNRGGMFKLVQAVRQLRGMAAPEVQVPNLEFALDHGSGGFLGARIGSATAILKRSS